MKDVCKALKIIYSRAPAAQTGNEMFENCFGELRRDVQELEKLHEEYRGTEFPARMKRIFQARKMKEKLVEYKHIVKNSMMLGIQIQTCYQTARIEEKADRLLKSVDESKDRMKQPMKDVPGPTICNLMPNVDSKRIVGRTEVCLAYLYGASTGLPLSVLSKCTWLTMADACCAQTHGCSYWRSPWRTCCCCCS